MKRRVVALCVDHAIPTNLYFRTITGYRTVEAPVPAVPVRPSTSSTTAAHTMTVLMPPFNGSRRVLHIEDFTSKLVVADQWGRTPNARRIAKRFAKYMMAKWAKLDETPEFRDTDPVTSGMTKEQSLVYETALDVYMVTVYNCRGDGVAKYPQTVGSSVLPRPRGTADDGRVLQHVYLLINEGVAVFVPYRCVAPDVPTARVQLGFDVRGA